jgi:hypothetical protein
VESCERPVIVSTRGDPISAKRISVGVRTSKWLGHMSDQSLQTLSQNRVDSPSTSTNSTANKQPDKLNVCNSTVVAYDSTYFPHIRMNQGHPRRPKENLSRPLIPSAIFFNSFTSQCAQTNFPFKNFASALAPTPQMMLEAQLQPLEVTFTTYTRL